MASQFFVAIKIKKHVSFRTEINVVHIYEPDSLFLQEFQEKNNNIVCRTKYLKIHYKERFGSLDGFDLKKELELDEINRITEEKEFNRENNIIVKKTCEIDNNFYV